MLGGHPERIAQNQFHEAGERISRATRLTLAGFAPDVYAAVLDKASES